METNEDSVQVLVFQTNIRRKSEVIKAGNVLGNHPQVLDWNIALSDVDKVLRVESRKLTVEDIVALITREGFECRELPD